MICTKSVAKANKIKYLQQKHVYCWFINTCTFLSAASSLFIHY